MKKLYVSEDTSINPTLWTLSFGKPEFQGGESIRIDEETAKAIMSFTSHMNNEQLKEEFISDQELAGEHGYCNQIMANKIANWWLSKMAERDAELVREVEGLKEEVRIVGLSSKDNHYENCLVKIGESIAGECRCGIIKNHAINYNQALDDVLAIISNHTKK